MEQEECANLIINRNREAIVSASQSASALAALIYGAWGLPADVREIATSLQAQVEAAIRIGCDDNFNYGEVYDGRKTKTDEHIHVEVVRIAQSKGSGLLLGVHSIICAFVD